MIDCIPYEIFDCIYNLNIGLFMHIFNCTSANLNKFWTLADNTRWYAEHTLKGIIDANKDAFIPGRLFGDEFQVGKVNCSWTVISWCSAISTCATLFQKMPIMLLREEIFIRPQVSRLVWEIIAWSFRVLASGRFPDRDWNNRLWPAGPRADKAGRQIAAGKFKIAYGQKFGDMQCLKNTFGLGESYIPCCV